MGGNFHLCAVDQKRPFFPRAGPFLDLLPFKGPFSLTGALTGPPYGKAPYGEASYGKAGPYRKPLTRRDGGAGVPYGSFTEKEDEEAYGKALTGRLLTRRPLTNYRKAYEKLWGETLPELGGNFRLCAVDQKRPFFPRAGPFLDLLPFKGPFSLTKALTGPPYGKAPYGEASYGKAGPLQPYEEGRSLREGPGSRTGALTGPPYGKAPYGEASYRKAGPLQYKEGRSLREGPGSRTGPSQRRMTKRLTGRQGPYEKPLTRRDGLREGPVPYGRAGAP